LPDPRVASAILCDFASVRENLLNVMSGGITRLWRPELPGPMGFCVAMMIEVPPEHHAFPHELTVEILDPNGKMIAKVAGGFQLAPRTSESHDPGESGFVPIAIDLRIAQVHVAGWHTVRVATDGKSVESPLKFKVINAAPPGRSGTPPPPRPAGSARKH